MKKVLIFLFVVSLLFNTAIFAEDLADISEKDVLFSCPVYPEFGKDSVKIGLSQICSASALRFSYNPDTGFLYAEDDGRKVYVKIIGGNAEFNEADLVLDNSIGADMASLYRFKAFITIMEQGIKSTFSLLAEAALEYTAEGPKLVLREIGTSSQTIDTGNINEYLEDNMLLVNKYNTLDRSYSPPELIYSKPIRGRSTVSLRLDRDAVEQLNYMLNAAYREGVSGMVITSAFRTYEKQTSLYNNKTSTLSRHMSRTAAEKEASKVVAVPGSSEHQTGLAVDICSEGVGLISNFADTRQGKWLKENSWRFGFIVRYPVDKTEITGIIYEPWHVRYVGESHSEIMKLKDMCLEEYVEYLKANQVIYHSNSIGENYLVQYINKPDFNLSGMTLSLSDTSTWSISECTKDSYILTIKL
ncbi:MAG TPA: M15 family metallopeptidase [Clostridia bacterium]|nr:M15 family metallopeptidase [Clostridia bacterium]